MAGEAEEAVFRANAAQARTEIQSYINELKKLEAQFRKTAKDSVGGSKEVEAALQQQAQAIEELFQKIRGKKKDLEDLRRHWREVREEVERMQKAGTGFTMPQYGVARTGSPFAGGATAEQNIKNTTKAIKEQDDALMLVRMRWLAAGYAVDDFITVYQAQKTAFQGFALGFAAAANNVSMLLLSIPQLTAAMGGFGAVIAAVAPSAVAAGIRAISHAFGDQSDSAERAKKSVEGIKKLHEDYGKSIQSLREMMTGMRYDSEELALQEKGDKANEPVELAEKEFVVAEDRYKAAVASRKKKERFHIRGPVMEEARIAEESALAGVREASQRLEARKAERSDLRKSLDEQRQKIQMRKSGELGQKVMDQALLEFEPGLKQLADSMAQSVNPVYDEDQITQTMLNSLIPLIPDEQFNEVSQDAAIAKAQELAKRAIGSVRGKALGKALNPDLGDPIEAKLRGLRATQKGIISRQRNRNRLPDDNKQRRALRKEIPAAEAALADIRARPDEGKLKLPVGEQVDAVQRAILATSEQQRLAAKQMKEAAEKLNRTVRMGVE